MPPSDLTSPPTDPVPPPPPTIPQQPLVPWDDEKPIPLGTSPDSLISQVQLECDNETAVLFFRYRSRLYLRVVKTADVDPGD